MVELHGWTGKLLVFFQTCLSDKGDKHSWSLK